MRRINTIGLAILATTALTSLAGATELRQLGTIAVPGAKLANFDISYINPATGRYYLADRSNKAIDVFDTATDTYVGA